MVVLVAPLMALCDSTSLFGCNFPPHRRHNYEACRVLPFCMDLRAVVDKADNAV